MGTLTEPVIHSVPEKLMTLSEKLRDLALDATLLTKQNTDREVTLNQIALRLRSMEAQADGLWDFDSLLNQVGQKLQDQERRIEALEAQLHVREEQVFLLQSRLNPENIERGDTVKIVGGWGPEGFPQGTLGVVKLINYNTNVYYVILLIERCPSYWIDSCYLEKQ